ncbi:MAG: hypothetical protein V1777_01265 [Candidatus Micrarchaeota archaeon]
MVRVFYEKQKPLNGSVEDFIIARHEFDENSKEFFGFSVTQISQVPDEVYTILRYYCSHGYCHCHRFYQSLNSKREDLQMPITPKTFAWCRKDILDNWQEYKKRYFSRWLK